MIGTALTEDDAFKLIRGWNVIPEEKRPLARAKLEAYLDERAANGEPLWPGRQAARERVEVERMEKLWLTDPTTDKPDSMMVRQIDFLSTVTKRKPHEVALEPHRYRRAVAGYLGDEAAAESPEAFDALARGFVQKQKERRMLISGNGNPEDVSNGGALEVFAADAARYNRPATEAWAEWSRQSSVKPGFADAMTEGESLFSHFQRVHERARQQWEGFGERADGILRELEARTNDGSPTLDTTAALPFLDGLTVPQRDAVLELVVDRAKAKAKAKDKGLGQQTGEAVGRVLARLVEAQIDVGERAATLAIFREGDPVPASLASDPAALVSLEMTRTARAFGVGPASKLEFPEPSVGPTVPLTKEQADAANKAARLRREAVGVSGKLRGIARGEVDPVRGSNWFTDKVYYPALNIAGSLGSSAIPGGWAANLTAYVGDEANRLEAAGMDSAAIGPQALIVGGLQAWMDRAQLSLMRKLPATSGLVQRLTAPAATRLGAFAQRVPGALGTTFSETSVEGFQQGFPLIAQKIFQALGADESDVSWDAIAKETWAAAPDTFFGFLPLVMLGAGVGSARDYKNVRSLVGDASALREVGFDDAQISRITKAGDAEAMVRALKAEWGGRTPVIGPAASPTEQAALDVVRDPLAPAGEVAVAAKSRAKIETTRRVLAEIQQAAGVKSVRRTAGGWTMENEDGTVTVGTPEEVRSAMIGMGRARSEKEAGAMMSLIDYFAAQDAAEDVGSVTSVNAAAQVARVGADGKPEAVSVRTKADGTVDVETLVWKPETLANLAAEMEAAGVSRASILGMNSALADDSGRLVRAYQTNAGADIRTILHERFERLYREGRVDEVGVIQAANILAALPQFDPARMRDPAQKKVAESLRKIALEDESVTDAERRETLVDLVVADVLGRWQDGTKLPAGAIEAGILEASMVGMTEEQQAAMGTFRGVWRAVKAYLKGMFGIASRIAQARRKGQLKEGDGWTDFVDKLLGVDAEKAHVEAVVEEVDESETFSLWIPDRFERVIPRDLFNEAKILAMVSKFAADVAAGKMPKGFSGKLSPRWSVALSEDGELYISGLSVSFDGHPVKITMPYNAGKESRFPLNITIEDLDIWGAVVYDESGEVDSDMQQFQSPPGIGEIAIPDWSDVIEELKRLGRIGLNENSGIEPKDGSKGFANSFRKGSIKNITNSGASFSLGERATYTATPETKRFTLPGGAELVGPASFSIRAFHGTPHKVGRFSLDRIGTGEGAQAFGWGLYFAENRGVGEGYRTAGPGVDVLKDSDGTWAVTKGSQVLSRGHATYPDAIAAKPVGNLYTVELLPDEADFLDWDAPPPDSILDRLAAYYVENELVDMDEEEARSMLEDFNSGAELYQKLSEGIGAEKASEQLAAIGVPGIRYLDGISRSSGDGSRNYVIFDDKLVRILEENGTPVEAGASFSIRATKMMEEGITKQDDKYNASRIGTAYQGKVNPTTQETNDGMASVTAEHLAKQMAKLTHFVKPSDEESKVVAVELPSYLTSISDPEKLRDAFIEWTKDNLLALHDAFMDLPGNALMRSTHWYDGARLIAEDIAAASGLTVEQAAAGTAAFSPMKDWFQNVAMAKNFSDAFANHRTVVITKAQHGKTMREIIRSAENPADRKKQFPQLEGKSVQSLWDEGTEESRDLAAIGIRLISQHVHGLEHDVYSPEGDSMGTRRNKDGSLKTMVWQSDVFILKALNIAFDGSLESISEQLGVQHKIRNFYNNIISPGSGYKDATIDTHHVNAAVLFPMGNKGYLVDLNFGKAGVAGGGNKGIYWLFHESLNRAAAERGLLPRQMQSITWEAVRGLFPDSLKSKAKFVAEIAEIWQTSPDASTARKRILGKGIRSPEWLRFDAGDTGKPVRGKGKTRKADGKNADGSRGVRTDLGQGKPSTGRRGGRGRDVGGTASLGSVNTLEAIAARLEERVALGGAVAKLETYQNIARNLEGMARAARSNEDVETILSLNKIEAQRRALRQKLEDEYVLEVYASPIADALTGDAATKIKDNEFLAQFIVPTAKGLVGRFTSPKHFRKAGKSMAEYEDALRRGLPSWLFRGPNSPEGHPDVIADNLAVPLSVPEMWERIEQELSSVSEAAAKLRKAQANIQEAKQRARDEAKAWASSERARMAASDKRDESRTLITLDAILAQLPAEVRGRVGGFTQLSQLKANDVRRKHFLEMIGKIDVEMEKYLRRSYLTTIRELFTKSKPKRQAGEKDRGRLGVNAHAWIETAEAASKLAEKALAEKEAYVEKRLSGAEPFTDAEIADLNRAWDFGEGEDAARMALEQESAILDLFGGLSHYKDGVPVKGSGEMEAALMALRATIETGRLVRESELMRRRADRETRRMQLQSDSGNAGKPADIKAREDAMQGFGGDAVRFMRKGFSLEQFIGDLFGRGSNTHRFLEDTVMEAELSETARFNQAQSDLSAFLRTLWPRTGRLGRIRNLEAMATPRPVPGAPPDSPRFSQLEAVHMTMLWSDMDSRDWLTMHGFGEDMQTALEAYLTPEARAVRTWLQEWYDDQYDDLNEVYRRIHGTNMPRVRNYSPRMVEHGKDAVSIDPLGMGGLSARGVFAGFTKRRRPTLSAAPVLADALQAWAQNQRVVTHFLSWAEASSELRAVFSTSATATFIKAAGGKQAAVDLNQWLSDLEAGGVADAQGSALWKRWLRANTADKLFGKLGVLAKQIPAAYGSAAEVGWSDWIKSARRVWAGEAARTRTEAAQLRIMQGRAFNRPDEFIQAARGRGADPVTGYVRRVTGDRIDLNAIDVALREVGSGIGRTDAFFTSFSAAVAYDARFREAKESGDSDDAAHAYAERETERVISRTAQPETLANKSLGENHLGTWGRILFMFQSANRQALYMTAAAFSDGGAKSGEAWRKAAMHWALTGLVTQTVGNIVRDLLTDDDEEEIWEVGDYLRAMTFGPLTGMLHAGPIIDAVASLLGGFERRQGTGPAAAITDLAKAFYAAMKDGEEFDWRDAEKVGRSLGLLLGGRFAALNVSANMAKQLAGAVDNLSESPEETAEREKKAKAKAKKEAKDAAQ